MTATVQPPPARPAPLVPGDVDLRGLEYMPLLGARLFSSDFNASASDGEWRAAVTLWWAAWGQVPAGSLPDDDVVLCRLADLGRDVKTWRRLKARALHGFVACSDGRLYHPVICEQALIAWDKRVKERDRKAKWRADKEAKQAGQRRGQDGSVPRDSAGTERGQERGRDGPVPADGTRRDGTGQEESAAAPPPPPARACEAPAQPGGHEPTAAGLACRAMRSAGMAEVNPGDPRLLALLAQGATTAELQGVAADAVARGKGFAWALKALEGRRADAAAIALAPTAAAVSSAAGARAVATTQDYLDSQRMTPAERSAAGVARVVAMQRLGKVAS